TKFEKIRFSEIPGFDRCYTISPENSFENLDSFKKGAFYIQDSAASFASYILMPEKNQTVLDMCAAPGGKSLYISDIMENTGRIISCDIYEHKLDLIKENAKKYGCTNIETILCDATVYDAQFREKADRVLCDVPCSGLGIIRKKPDIRYSRKEEDIESLASLSEKILDNASKYLKKGGILVFSTCTIEPEENEKAVEKFLASHKDFEIYHFGDNNLPYKTFYPNIDGTDGFFVCRLKKNGEE
ncbi:MAG: methyltransferase domain-containing protein, partial [Clostridia bacterium]|nr:methyltransferase domain-containing protein [Clostridia bacterium]